MDAAAGSALSPRAAREQYQRWNQALVEVVFSGDSAGRPVYLDMDDYVVRLAAERAGADPALGARELLEAVRGTLRLSGAGAVFGEHLLGLQLWRTAAAKARVQRELPPPSSLVALLAALTLAAEAMGRDAECAPNAYYPRLCTLLRISDPQEARRLEHAYRSCAEQLWRGLNDWLVATDGQFGLPSAWAISHRYVGLPMSQALVRDADRRHLPRMFHHYGLPPGSEASPTDMERLLDAWIRQTPCPVSKSLEALWVRGQARERIATVAAVELLGWDGSLAGTDDSEEAVERKGDALLVAQVRRFPRPQWEFSFVADLRTLPSPRSLVVLSAPNQPTIDVVPAVGSRVQPTRASELDAASLIEGTLHLADPSSGRDAWRRPRRVVPMRRDELLNAYVECERVQLGEDVLLLVKEDRGLPDAVTSILTQIARPGFHEESSLPGQPPGWTAFLDVQIMTGPAAEPDRSDLNALVPLLSTQLMLAGGLKLPGRVRKWSSLDPPEIRAVVQDANSIVVSMTPLGDDPSDLAEQSTWESDEPMVVIDLAALGFTDGDYEISLRSGGRVHQLTTLRLRSSDTPDIASWQCATRLVHDFESGPIAAMTATPISESPAEVVDGPYTTDLAEPAQSTTRCAATVWWVAPREATGAPNVPVVVALRDPNACVVTGAHRFQLPTFYGKPTTQLVTGVCDCCGLVKRFPAWYSPRRFAEWRTANRQRGSSSMTVDVSRLPKVRHGDIDWDTAFDALVHVGGGQLRALERVALQMEGSRLFVDDFLRSLEVRGDLEVRRGTLLEPEEWEVTPAYLAELGDGTFLVTGCWSRQARSTLQDAVATAGGTVRVSATERGPSAYIVCGVSREQLNEVAAATGAEVAPAASSRMLSALPPLSRLEANLPRIPMPGTRRINRFHVESASWVPTSFAAETGAYRLEGEFATTDVFRTADDIDRGEAALGTVQLTKHLAARLTGHPLLAYDESHQRLVVPLGADLPGLYGRAVVLASGRLPTPLLKDRLLVYHDVGRPAADRLAELFTT